MKKIRLFAAALALPFFAACYAEAPPVEANTGPMCGPCDMTMPEGFPLTEIAGLRFAVCGGRCEELITEDPVKYREFAVGE
jgi:hypothetical protein